MNMMNLKKELCLGRLILMTSQEFSKDAVIKFLKNQGFCGDETHPISVDDFLKMARTNFFTEVLLGRRLIVVDLAHGSARSVERDLFQILQKHREIKLRYGLNLILIYSKTRASSSSLNPAWSLLLNARLLMQPSEVDWADEWVHQCIFKAAESKGVRVLGMTERAALTIEKSLKERGLKKTEQLIWTAVRFLEDQRITEKSTSLAGRIIQKMSSKAQKIEA